MCRYVCNTSVVRIFGAMFDHRMPPRGFSMLEYVVAMALFGIALSGLFPILVEYSRQVQRLEKCSPQCRRWDYDRDSEGKIKRDPEGKITWINKLDPTLRDTDSTIGDYRKLPSSTTNRYSYPDQWHLVPASDPWMWKLGAAASLVPDDPTQLTNDPTTGGIHKPYLRPFPCTAPTSPTLIADDSIISTADPSFGYYAASSGANWVPGPTTGGYRNTSQRLPSTGTASWAATWTFKNVPPGWYEVWAIWPDPYVYALPKPDPPNDVAINNVAYRMLNGVDSVITSTVLAGVDQTAPPSGRTDDNSVNWTPISWIASSITPTMVYIPKRDVTDNYTTTTDANGHLVQIYNGDTIKVQIQVPATSGFITADGMTLVAKPNTIKRSSPLVWSWSPSCQQVTATVTVTNQ